MTILSHSSSSKCAATLQLYLTRLFSRGRLTSQHWPMSYGQLLRPTNQLDQQRTLTLSSIGVLCFTMYLGRDVTYDAISSLYVHYVASRYRKATVVFDGYQNGPSTKDCTHQRRTGAYGPTVNFDCAVVAKLKKDDFIANKANKQRFINLLGTKLELSGCIVIHARKT